MRAGRLALLLSGALSGSPVQAGPDFDQYVASLKEQALAAGMTTFLTKPVSKAQIEVALDRGHIHATTRDGPRSLPLLEVELELKQGPPDALFSLARQLGHNAHLRPVAASKSERGYVLFQGRRAKAVKAEAVTLPPSEHPVDAFRRVALACLSQLQANEAGVLHSSDAKDAQQALSVFLRLRLSDQLRKLKDAQPIDNHIDVRALRRLDRELLRDALRVVNQFKDIVADRFKLRG